MTSKRDLKNLFTDPIQLCRRLLLFAQKSPNGDGVMVCCPNPEHEDKHPSCHVFLGQDGTLGAKCFACGWGADVFGIVAAVRGLDLRAQFPDVLAETADLYGGPLPDDVPPPPPRPPREWPKREDLRRVWIEAGAFSADAIEYLRSRGIEPEAAFSEGLLRQLRLEQSIRLPSWCYTKHSTWAQSYPLVTRTWDAEGIVRGLRGWSFTGTTGPKRIAPTGVRAQGVILANAPAVKLLSGELPGARQVLIVEGEPDWLTWSLALPDSGTLGLPGIPVLGVLAGSWSADFAAKIPDGCEVIVRTHRDPAGERYAFAVQDSVWGRCSVWRLEGEGPDENDQLQQGVLPKDPKSGCVERRRGLLTAEPRQQQLDPPSSVDAEVSFFQAPEPEKPEKPKKQRKQKPDREAPPPPEEPITQAEHEGPQFELIPTTRLPKPCLRNVVEVMLWDTEWSGALGFNEFTGVIETLKPIPARDALKAKESGEWTEVDATRAADWIGLKYRFHPMPLIVTAAAEAVARTRSFHPVRAYLDTLRWDGHVRIPTLFRAYFGAEHSEYHEAVARAWLVSGVARVRNPGCKVDAIVILEGPQGSGKSTAVRILGGDWFRDTRFVIGDKDAYQSLRACWLYELAELSSISTARDIETLKSFITSSSDYYRPSYGRRAILFPRQCIFVGTTNQQQYLMDDTGARRYLPVKTGHIALEALARDRDQLWAEADLLYQAGTKWYLEGAAQQAAVDSQEERTSDDPWDERVRAWLRDPILVAGFSDSAFSVRANLDLGITSTQVLSSALDLKPYQQGRHQEMRVGAVLRRLGFERRRTGGKLSRVWKYFLRACQAEDGGVQLTLTAPGSHSAS